jgi:hypothetical protein
MDRNLLLTAFLLIAGIIVGGWYGPSLLQETAAVQSWQPTPATLTDARVVRESGGTGSARSNSYKVGLTYSYQVNGMDYVGSRYQVSHPLTLPTASDAQLKVDELMSTPQIEILVNPDAPAEAVMDQGGAGYAWLVTLFGAAMAASGAFVYFTRVRVS